MFQSARHSVDQFLRLNGFAHEFENFKIGGA